MATVERPDGAQIHWREAGEGPLVVITTQLFANPSVIQGLADDLVTDHRVVSYDPRGCGSSSSGGPYDNPTDADDLAAVIEAAGGPAVVIGMGNCAMAAVLAANDEPDLVTAVVVPFGNPVAIRAARDSDALVGSRGVLQGLDEMMANDYRAALRSVVSSGNPQMTEEEIRDRVDRQVAYSPAEVAMARLMYWQRDSVETEARSLGDRLWILQHPHDPWFPADMIGATRELLPEAVIEEVEDGFVSRPDLAAGVVRRVLAGGGPASPD